MNKNLRNVMAFFGLAQRHNEIEWQEWHDEQKRKLECNEEIEPPWIQFNETPPWSGSWRQGTANFWTSEFWKPFWTSLNVEEKREYLEKWIPPDDDWNEYITLRWWSDILRNEDWLESQRENLKNNLEIEPPWVAFPLSLVGTVVFSKTGNPRFGFHFGKS